ncbi:dynein regulatory complex subunit 3-like isoform X2 [Bacillus rossius redtenbacheri]|uniref:dynein regulatory complex subunit 3-like isoform X1 n=1 Tax=Bacillus rossius redtenbacheri TaxID=93214 RepID=UPI002FDEB10B
MSIIDETSAPGVINYEMIMEAMIKQGPQDEAGRLAKEEGLSMDEVEKLRLEFLNILRIDHLWPLTSLTSLCLSNNVIEQIENLHTLVNLRELNLSFNRIEVLENLEALTRLEVLLLFENAITCIENIDTLQRLMILSIGNNRIVDRSHVIYLRRFPKLHSLNMAGNPCAESVTFREYVEAFLPGLTYLEYKMISPEDKKSARQHYREALERMEEEEEKVQREREETEARRKELEWHTAMFVEGLGPDQLFHSMFEKDAEGKAMLQLSEEAEQSYDEYRAQVAQVSKQVFQIGVEQHKARQDEIRQFSECVAAAKKWSNEKCFRLVEEFQANKAAIFEEVHKVIQGLKAGHEMDDGFSIEVMQRQSDEFSSLTDTTWYSLVQTERILSEQLEEVMGQFERNLNDLVSTFIEQAQALFVELRGYTRGFNEHLSEIAGRFMAARLADTEATDVPEELLPFMQSRETMTTALENSLETQVLVIDTRDDTLRERTQSWATDYIDTLQRKEVQRNRARMAEINHFIEVQTNEYDELINTMGGMDDLFPEA